VTLAIGDKLVKLNRSTGKPIKNEESYVEFEVVDLSPTYDEQIPGKNQGKVVQFAKLLKLR